jgi:hypothetical protein
MISFQAKNTNLGKSWRAPDWKMLIYFMAIWNMLQTFEIFYDHLVHFFRFWVIFGKKNLATLLKETLFSNFSIISSARRDATTSPAANFLRDFTGNKISTFYFGGPLFPGQPNYNDGLYGYTYVAFCLTPGDYVCNTRHSPSYN